MIRAQHLLYFTLLTSITLIGTHAVAEDRPVGITSELMSLEVTHNGEKVEIIREQDNSALLEDDFAKTSRPCPPFCIQPMTLADGVDTLGELELLDYLAQVEAGDASILLLDSRTPDWVKRGTIPGSTNVSWKQLAPKQGATTEGITRLMTETFAVKLTEGTDMFAIDEAVVAGDTSAVFDYSSAKTLVLFCNGMWCGQSPESIRTLLKFGYPAEKLKWYRDGMQGWKILGLTVVADE